MFLYFVFIVLLFHSFLGDALKEKHYLHFKFTALSVANTFPEFSAEAVADDKQIVYYNNKDESWVRESLTEDDWTKSPALPPDSRDWFIHLMKTLSNCAFSDCSELHVLQRIVGCELEKRSDGSESLRLFDEYGFDGEDFISFNPDTLQWIDKNPKAKETKREWDLQTERNQFLQLYLKTCVHWISTFNNTRKSRPNVHAFVQKYDHYRKVLICLATGFYPREIEMNISLDRVNVENKTSSVIRPNDDGSFQMRTSVEINSNYKGSYHCFVIHSSLTEPISTEWDGTWNSATESHWLLIAVIGGIVLLLLLVRIGYWIHKKKTMNCHMNSSEGQTKDSDTGNKKRKSKRKLAKGRFKYHPSCSS